MNADLEHLVVLQAQDLELARLRGELAELPKRGKAAEGALSSAEAALAGCKARLATEEKLRRGQESEIAAHRVKLERLRKSLDGAANAQQVSAFEHEIGFAQNGIRTLEDEELASMERTETSEAELQTCTAAAAKVAGSLAAERARAAELKARNEATIVGVERERGELRKQIAERWLNSYDRLVKTRGTAVAEAIGTATAGKCAACQMGVRPQRWQDLIGREHGDEIFPCETCGRLLFWDPRRDTPKPWAAGERLQAAQAAVPVPPSGGGR